MQAYSPVDGVVNSFFVEDGAEVAQGDCIAQVESMKMMFYVEAPCAGIVTLKTELGKVVKRGQLVAEVK